MSRSLIAYNPNACECCGCPPAVTEIQTKFVSSEAYGYIGFTLPTHTGIYRTSISRGWGLSVGPLLIRNEVHCSHLLGGSYWGVCDSVGHSCWDPFDMPPPPECVYVASSACADSFLSFSDSPATGYAIDSDSSFRAAPPDETIRPVGVEILLNPITTAEFLEEVLNAARDETWADTGTLSAYYAKTGNVTAFAVKFARFRFRFRAPATGYRASWDVTWTPRSWNGSAWVDGTPEAYESAEWEWDGVVPGDYDVGDSETWPTSPWFELPEALTDGTYTAGNFLVECGSPSSPVAPSSISGYSR